MDLRLLISKEYGINPKFLEIPPDSRMGDVSYTISFKVAKEEKKSPRSIAEDVYKELKPKGIVREIKLVGPYINFFFNKSKLGEKIVKECSKKVLVKKDKKEKVMVEFFQPNTHKGIHIGHARNVIIGESISRILEERGNKVVRTTYGGDIGPHVAKCLWGVKHLGKKPSGDKGEWLGKIYALANEKGDEDEINNINKGLYSGDKELVSLWKKTKKWSVNHMKKILGLVNTKMDGFIWESMVEKQGLEIAKDLVKKGVLEESDGAIIANLEDYGLGIVVVVTKEGTPLYPAKDLGLVMKEFKDYGVSRVVHVVGVEQSLYFKQLFKLFELAGWKKWVSNSVHKSYELVDLKEGKMSSRKGNVVLFTELYNKMMREALKQNKDKKIAEQVTISALKYGMLKYGLNKKVLFDYKDWVSFEGDTGPYVQYSLVRALKILSKMKNVKPANIVVGTDDEYELLKKLALFEQVFNTAYERLDPSLLANYAYSLAYCFSKFYESSPVVKSDLAGSRKRIVMVYVNVLSKVIGLLGLEPMKKM